jgi:hypothetical protein
MRSVRNGAGWPNIGSLPRRRAERTRPPLDERSFPRHLRDALHAWPGRHGLSVSENIFWKKTHMNQTELNRAVARATGESLATIRRLGFLLADFDRGDQLAQGPDWDTQVIDWNRLADDRITSHDKGTTGAWALR